jgi:hypothetical protein
MATHLNWAVKKRPFVVVFPEATVVSALAAVFVYEDPVVLP